MWRWKKAYSGELGSGVLGTGDFSLGLALGVLVVGFPWQWIPMCAEKAVLELEQDLCQGEMEDGRNQLVSLNPVDLSSGCFPVQWQFALGFQHRDS